MSLDSYEVVCIIIIVLTYIIVLPLNIYFLIFFYRKVKNRVEDNTETFFSRRHPSTIYAILFLTIFSVAIQRPVVFLMTIFNVLNLTQNNRMPIAYFLIALSSNGIMYIFWLRTWTIYYTYKYHVAEAKIKWKKQLNPDYDMFDNFFYQNRSLWGKFTFVSPFIFILWMISVILLTICAATLFKSFALSNILIILPPFIFLAYITYKISPVNDMYIIRDELVFCISVLALTVVLYLIFFFSIYGSGENEGKTKLAVVFSSAVGIVSNTILCFIITFWVIRKYDREKYIPNTRRNSKSYTASKQMSIASKQKLAYLLRDKRGYHLFMDHLMKEVSVENLLFVTEYIQFKRHMSKTKLNGDIIGWMEEIPEDAIPPSEVITKYGNNVLNQIHLIYDKYIKPESELEVNIAGKTRKKYTKAFDYERHDGKVDDKLIALGFEALSYYYDKPVEEVWSLMKDSFSRCTPTVAYQTWWESLPRGDDDGLILQMRLSTNK